MLRTIWNKFCQYNQQSCLRAAKAHPAEAEKFIAAANYWAAKFWE